MRFIQQVAHPRPRHDRSAARKLLGWPKRCKLARAFLWEYSYKRLELAQLLGQLGVFLTRVSVGVGVRVPSLARTAQSFLARAGAGTAPNAGGPGAVQRSSVMGFSTNRQSVRWN
jgi:hypothetical protein